jgi:hypothetical protein
VVAELPKDDAEVLAEMISLMKKLDADGRKRIYQTIGTFFQLHSDDEPFHSKPGETTPFEPAKSHPSSVPTFSADRTPSPKHFLQEKQPRTDVERVACLAFYLAHYRDTPAFTTLDISKVNTEAAQRKLANATVAVNNASQYGYLVPAGKGLKQISAAGERYVQALPDYDAAKEAMAAARPRWKARRGEKAKS